MSMSTKFKGNNPCCKTGSRRTGSKNPSYTLWYHAKMRAEKKGLPFTLKVSDVEDMVSSTQVCPVMGTPFCWTNSGVKDNSPTLDKFDPSLGYTKENTQLISFFANRIKSNATTSQIGKVYVWMRKKELEKIIS